MYQAKYIHLNDDHFGGKVLNRGLFIAPKCVKSQNQHTFSYYETPPKNTDLYWLHFLTTESRKDFQGKLVEWLVKASCWVVGWVSFWLQTQTPLIGLSPLTPVHQASLRSEVSARGSHPNIHLKSGRPWRPDSGNYLVFSGQESLPNNRRYANYF